MEPSYRVSQAARLLGVCIITIHRWDANSKIQCYRTPGGHRRIPISEIRRLQGSMSIPAAERRTAIYARVSSHDQKKKGDLQRQIDTAQTACQVRGQPSPFIFQDVASGLNVRRRGLQRLFQVIEQGKVDEVVLTYPDRLTRFGFQYLERYFASYGTNITMLHQIPTQNLQDELVQDVIAIITSFSGRIHGLRSRRRKQQKSVQFIKIKS